MIDIGGRRQGFPSDITRMAAVGRAPEGYAEVHAVVERAVQAALAAARPGVTARTVDAAARTVIADAGYGDHFVHRTGHGIGIDIHEPPYITSTSETVLEAGMSFSIEPGIYLPGRFGIRLEEIVVLRDDGPRIPSGLSRSCGSPDRSAPRRRRRRAVAREQDCERAQPRDMGGDDQHDDHDGHREEQADDAPDRAPEGQRQDHGQ